MNQHPYPWTAFGIMVGAGTIALFLALPRPLELIPLLASVTLLALLVGIGLLLAKNAGLRVSTIENSSAGANHLPWSAQALMLGQSLLIGAGVGIVILIAIRFFILPIFPAIQSRYAAEANVAVWERIVIAFDSTIIEEFIFRLFLFSSLVWLAGRIWQRQGAPPSIKILWAINALIAIGFGLAHLPGWSQVITLTPLVIGIVVFLNSIGGLTFGYLYFRKGLEAAIFAHFAADIVLHVIGPGFLKIQ